MVSQYYFRSLARALKDRSAPLALRSAKQAISRATELPLESGSHPTSHTRIHQHIDLLAQGLDFERAAYEPLLKSKDRMEALRAFKEKRAPVFKGE